MGPWGFLGSAAVELRRPRADDRPLWDVVFGVYAFPAVLAAHRFKLFPLLVEQPRTVAEVCEALRLERRPAETMLAAAVARSASATPERGL